MPPGVGRDVLLAKVGPARPADSDVLLEAQPRPWLGDSGTRPSANGTANATAMTISSPSKEGMDTCPPVASHRYA